MKINFFLILTFFLILNSSVNIANAADPDCKANGLYLNNGSCVFFCPADQEFSYNNVCSVNCGVRFADGKICRDTCPNDKYELTDGNNKSCVKTCPDNFSFINGRECILSCPAKFIGKICLSTCPLNRPYDQNNQCVSSCSDPKPLIDGTVCVDTCSGSKKKSQGICVDNCPTSLPYHNTITKECVSQCPVNTVLEDNECKQSCSGGKFKDNGVCKASCPVNKITDETAAECVSSCPLARSYVESRKCVASCSSYRIDNLCVSSCPLDRFRLEKDKTCLSTCPPITAPIPAPFIDGKECKSACPAKFIGNICLSTCPLNRPYDQNNQCVSSCSDLKPLLDGTVCVDTCSGSKKKSQGICVETCPTSLPYHNTITNECVNQCPVNTVLEDNECKQSCSGGRYNDGGVCKASCPVNKNTDETSKLCLSTCVDPRPFAENRICLDSCPNFRVGNLCLASCPATMYINGNECVTECPPITAPIPAPFIDGKECKSACPAKFIGNICLSTCPLNRPYDKDNECVSSCSDLKPLLDGTVCVDTCSGSKKKSQGICVDNCPTSLPYHNIVTNECVNQCTGNTVLEDNECKQSCSADRYNDDGVCKASCPVNKNTDETSKLCLSTCVDPRPFVENRICLDSCPVNKVSADNICLDACPADRYLVNINKTCVTECPSDAKFVDGKECKNECPELFAGVNCLLACPENFPYLNGKECVDACSGDNKLLNGTDCVPSCPEGKKVNIEEDTCLDSCPLDNFFNTTNCLISCSGDEYYYGKECLAQCPEGINFVYGKECIEECDKFIDGSFCLDVCPKDKYTEINILCTIACSDDNPFIDGKDCVKACPEGKLADGNICKCPENLFTDGKECLEKCPELKYTDGKECVEICPDLKYTDGTECVEKCPDSKYTDGKECVDACPANKLTDGKECKEDCPAGEFGFPDCKNCDPKCGTCKDFANNCLSCKEGTLLTLIGSKCSCPNGYFFGPNNICEKDTGSCPSYFYRDERSKICEKCPNNCKSCTNSKQCSACDTGFVYDTSINSCVPEGCINYCKNFGECYKDESGARKCKCSVFLQGEFCETLKEVEINITDSAVNDATISYISLLGDLVSNSNGQNVEVSQEKINLVTDLASQQLDLVKSGQIPPDPNVLKIFSSAISLNLFGNSNVENAATKIENLKSSVSDFSNFLIKNLFGNNQLRNRNRNLESNVPVPVSYYYTPFSLQFMFYTPENVELLNLECLTNDISIVDAKECDAAIKKALALNASVILVVKKIDYHPLLNVEQQKVDSIFYSTSVLYEFLDPNTFNKINLDSCKNVNITIKAPNTNTLSDVNLETYKSFRVSGLDQLDINSQAYVDRCIAISDPITKGDATIGYRINNYFLDRQANCGANCAYGGLDDNSYVTCLCQGLTDGERVSNYIQKNPVIDLKINDINCEVIKCFPQVWKMNDRIIFENPAFWIGVILMIIKWTFFLLRHRAGKSLIETNISDVIDNDCTFSNEINYNSIRPNNNENVIQYSSNVKPTQNNYKNNQPEIPIAVAKPKDTSPEDFQQGNKFESKDVAIDTVHKFNPTENNNEAAKNNPNVVKQQPNNNYNNYSPKVNLYDDLTSKDYNKMSPYEAATKDNRGFLRVFFHYLVNEHVVFRWIFKKSLMYPLWIELHFFCIRLNVIFMLNALIFIDRYIDQRIDNHPEDEFAIVWTREFPKTILSVAGAIIATAIFSLFVIVPRNQEKDLNNALKTKDLGIIKNAHDAFNAKMKWRQIIFLIITVPINIFMWFYCISFCGIYHVTARGWVVGSFVGLLFIDWMFLSIFIPLFRTCLRLLSRSSIFRFLAGIEWLFWITQSLRR